MLDKLKAAMVEILLVKGDWNKDAVNLAWNASCDQIEPYKNRIDGIISKYNL